MYAKIEGSGCDIRKGKVQIRIAMYLEPGDARYDERHVHVLDVNSKKYKKGYLGEVDIDDVPVDMVDYDNWLDSLPKIWQDNTFHNHFIYIDPDDDLISVINEIKGHLSNFYVTWANEEYIVNGWLNRTELIPGDTSSVGIVKCENTLLNIKNNFTAILIRL